MEDNTRPLPAHELELLRRSAAMAPLTQRDTDQLFSEIDRLRRKLSDFGVDPS